MDLTIESMRDGDDARLHALMRQAFGGTSPHDPDEPAFDPSKIVCSYLGEDMVGSVITLDFAQTWGGQAVPCGGVSGVAVAPEARGLGAARRMLRESLDRMVERGQVLSALYPTTASLYRSMGYEVVGWYRRRGLPLAEAPTDAGGDVRWRRAAFGDPAVRAVHDQMSARHDGWFRLDPEWWSTGQRRAARAESENRFCYVGSRAGQDVAVVQYRYRSAGDFYDLQVDVLAGVDGPALAAALAVLGRHGTTARTISIALPDAILAAHVPQVQRAAVESDWPFMLRIVDAPVAIQARGWPDGVHGRADLDVVDDVLPANAGPHVLEIGGGEARLVPGGTGAVTVAAGDLAVLYAGGDPSVLREAGRLTEASPATLDLLRAAFASNPTIDLFF
jgi:predicted acetyltransferase